MDFLWVILLIAVIIFFAEKTGYRLLNFGAFGLFLYLAFTVDSVLLMGIFIFLGLALMGFSIFGEGE